MTTPERLSGWMFVVPILALVAGNALDLGFVATLLLVAGVAGGAGLVLVCWSLVHQPPSAGDR